MNIWIAVAPPMVADILAEFTGRSVIGHWLNPPGLTIVDVQCSQVEYDSFKTRPGVTVWGAWDDNLIVRDSDTGEIIVGNKVEARPDIINIVPDLPGGGRPLIFTQCHLWLGQEDRGV